MSVKVNFMVAANWFESLSNVEKDLARMLMLTVQRDYGFTFDRAIIVICEAYMLAKQGESERKGKASSLDMDDATLEALRRELNGKKGN